jgi:dethiobiotin synthetase
MRRGYFVTGTGTGVGKTRVSCALLHAFAERGKIVVGMKPVAAGMENGKWEDVELLSAAGNINVPRELINPYAFIPPIAPHIAAERAGIRIDVEVIRNALCKLQELADAVIVEGVGGFLVPLNERQNGADLAVALGLPVILVVGMQLGCLSHALLTAQAVQAAGLTLAGWVANGIDPAMQAFDENVSALERRLKCPLLGVLPFQQSMDCQKMHSTLDIAAIRPDRT